LVAGIGLAIAVVVWPREDSYAFLRSLNPKEEIGESIEMPGNRPTGEYSLTFSFSQPIDQVIAQIERHWPRADHNKPFKDGVRSLYFDDPGHRDTSLWLPTEGDPPGCTCVLVIWNVEVPWLERQKIALRKWLHLN